MVCTFSSGVLRLLLLSVFLLAGHAASLKFSIHHRLSDSIKAILGSEGLPEKHTPGYYAVMVHRDRLLHSRRLASTNGDPPLSFVYGNETYRIDGLGFLHYANVSVGMPELIYLVALDTGSDLFWLPCECSQCPTYLSLSEGGKYKLNHYSPNASTTSSNVPCSNSLCELANQCSSNKNTCPYKTHNILSANTSSAGYLVHDIMHFAIDDSQRKPVDANITLGCGKVQTGMFPKVQAPNGLLGLGMGKISVPSILASQGLITDSFSMCFGYRGSGRIEFGDVGPSGQRETPFNPSSSSYNVTFIQIIVAVRPTNVEFTAVFDAGSFFTHLTDPTYTLITEKMDAMMTLDRFTFDSDYPFEYCYTLALKTKLLLPTLNFTMKGGYNYGAIIPFLAVPTDDVGGYALCLAIVKSNYTNVIGHQFMIGHRIVFNREKMVLGWTEIVDCNDNGPDTPSRSPPTGGSPPPGDSVPSPSTLGRSNSTPPLSGIDQMGDATRLNSLSSLLFVNILAIILVVVCVGNNVEEFLFTV